MTTMLELWVVATNVLTRDAIATTNAESRFLIMMSRWLCKTDVETPVRFPAMLCNGQESSLVTFFSTVFQSWSPFAPRKSVPCEASSGQALGNRERKRTRRSKRLIARKREGNCIRCRHQSRVAKPERRNGSADQSEFGG